MMYGYGDKACKPCYGISISQNGSLENAYKPPVFDGLNIFFACRLQHSQKAPF